MWNISVKIWQLFRVIDGIRVEDKQCYMGEREISSRIVLWLFAGAWLMAPEVSLCVVKDQPVGNPKRKV
jgi:hypothetical protein